MTIKDLREAIEGLPDDMQIAIGCDGCGADAASARVEERGYHDKTSWFWILDDNTR